MLLEILLEALKRLFDEPNKQNFHKAQGVDHIPPRTFKDLNAQLSEPLSMLFELNLETNRIPNDWNEAEVTAPLKMFPKKPLK